MNSSSTSEAGQLPADPIDKKHSEISQSESTSSTPSHRVITKGSSQKTFMYEGRELLHILIHKCSHTPASRGKLPQRLRNIVIDKQRQISIEL
jgi:hypothetical protein